VIGRDGEPFRAPVQISRQLDEERRRADEAAERAARYAAKLRELGIEPD
jgi:hypothetical protein